MSDNKKVGKSPKCTVKKCGLTKGEAKTMATKLRSDGIRARFIKKDSTHCVMTCGKRKAKKK
jgi:hypothetical protein